MAGVRDPAFWRRFSMAVHMDEEKANMSDSGSASSSSSHGGLKHTATWLERNRKKQRRTMIVGWLIALSFLIVAAAVVLVILWVLNVGPFKR
ncbi:hypothetical protein PV08_03394 [Exophiala spinifera]|uniref:Uncharacterized protein n=1 Tax=Exophiala spinifera TaxID=91928 RepID=A0A0D2A2E7_9EURO|nr:uncharacterized protein PV08_03394 [Exophiala spinifera]KIW19102.1 hypothetical protein PV08_03394 [Exophiala spinifera]